MGEGVVSDGGVSGTVALITGADSSSSQTPFWLQSSQYPSGQVLQGILQGCADDAGADVPDGGCVAATIGDPPDGVVLPEGGGVTGPEGTVILPPVGVTITDAPVVMSLNTPSFGS